MTSDSDVFETIDDDDGPDLIELPAPTAWPMALALGVCMLAAGLVTSPAFSLLGLLLFIAGAGGWIYQLGPEHGETHEPVVPESERAKPIRPAPERIDRLEPGSFGHRMLYPEKVHPYSAGVRGGIAGAFAMATVALAYGLVSGHGVWYPINLVSAMALPGFDVDTIKELEQFSAKGLVLAIVIHGLSSTFLGLIYAMLLPMAPSWPIVWGGVVAPLLWTGMLHGFLGILNPAMDNFVDWKWFIASQFAYAIVAGVVVVRSEKVYASHLWTSEPVALPDAQANDSNPRGPA